MPKIVVYPCPSCGASLTIDEGAASTVCQFCGNTAVIPQSLRTPAPPPPAPPDPLPLSAFSYVNLADVQANLNSAYGVSANQPNILLGPPVLVADPMSRVGPAIGLHLAITGVVVVLTACVIPAAMLGCALLFGLGPLATRFITR